MDHTSGVVKCEAYIRQIEIDGESKPGFNVHPGTVDACLQSIIASIYKGKLGSVANGFVPINIKTVTVYAATDSIDEAPAMIDTWVEEGRDRHYSANSQMTRPDGRLLLDFQGVHCVAYEAVVPQLLQGSQRELPYWQVRWLPSLELNAIPEALQAFPNPGIRDVVALLCHGNASTRVLDIDGMFTHDIVKDNPWIDITVSEYCSDQGSRFNEKHLTDLDSVKIIKLESLKSESTSSLVAVYDMIISSEVLAPQLVKC